MLTGRHADDGVFRDGSAGDTLSTLASMVADLIGGRLTVRGPSGPAETVPLAAFARGASTHG